MSFEPASSNVIQLNVNSMVHWARLLQSRRISHRVEESLDLFSHAGSVSNELIP